MEMWVKEEGKGLENHKLAWGWSSGCNGGSRGGEGREKGGVNVNQISFYV